MARLTTVRDGSDSDDDDIPFTLTQDQQSTLFQSLHTKPSDLPAPARGKDSLLFLSPEELTALAAKQDADDAEAVEEPVELWEELATAALWTIPFAFLFSGMYVEYSE